MISRALLHPILLLLTLAAVPATGAEVEPTDFQGHPAFRISDGKTEAVIVPELAGRLMRFGVIGGKNWIWNPGDQTRPKSWSNVGGDKTFIGPHPAWKQFVENIWPPPLASWDLTPHQAEILPRNRLRTTGPVWEGFGARVIREFSFDADGDFIIEQTLEKVEASDAPIAVWNVTQIVPPEAIFFLADPSPARTGGFQAMSEMPDAPMIDRAGAGLVQIKPTTGKSYKIGADSPFVAIAAVKDGVALLERAMHPPAAPVEDGLSFPVEFYNHREGGAAQYVELELLTGKRVLRPGEKLTQTLHWSLHTLPAGDARLAEVKRLLMLPTERGK
jgi:hypothetical protein